jgi:hypothetical protein
MRTGAESPHAFDNQIIIDSVYLNPSVLNLSRAYPAYWKRRSFSRSLTRIAVRGVMSRESQKELEGDDPNFTAVEYGIMIFLTLTFVEMIASRF